MGQGAVSLQIRRSPRLVLRSFSPRMNPDENRYGRRMDRVFMVRFSLIGLAVLVGQSHAFSQIGFDSGRDASGLAALVVADSSGVNWQGRWLRVRSVPFPEFGPMGELFWRNPAQRDEARAALGRLREKGVKTCIFMRWPAAAWPSGGRKSVGFCGHDEHPDRNGRELGAGPSPAHRRCAPALGHCAPASRGAGCLMPADSGRFRLDQFRM